MIKIYTNKIENRTLLKIETGSYLELSNPETMKLHGYTESKITKDKYGENVPYLEITEVVLIPCNLLNNSYQQNSRVLHIFVPNKSFGQLLDISSRNLIFLKMFDSEFSYIELLFTDRNSNPLEIEEKINITAVINESIRYKKWHAIHFDQERIFVKGYGFLPFTENIDRNISKNLHSKYIQELLDHAKQSATEALKKRVIQKTEEATSDLIGNKIADKITTLVQNNLETNE